MLVPSGNGTPYRTTEMVATSEIRVSHKPGVSNRQGYKTV